MNHTKELLKSAKKSLATFKAMGATKHVAAYEEWVAQLKEMLAAETALVTA